jgi:hypothetical protein
MEASPWSRGDRRIWSFICLGMATAAAFALAPIVEQLTPCTDCGSTLFGTICSGSGYGTCDGYLAAGAAVIVVLLAGSVAFAMGAVAARRMRRSGPEPSSPLPPDSAGRRFAQTAALTVFVAGIEFALAGLLTPFVPIFFFAGGEHPSTYVLAGLGREVAAIAAVVAAAGILGWIAATRRSARFAA